MQDEVLTGLWHNPFVFGPTNPGDPVLLRICKVFQDGGHANSNRHYILILGRKYEKFFVVLLSFLHLADKQTINYCYTRAKIDQVDATLFAEQRLNNVVIKVQQHLLN